MRNQWFSYEKNVPTFTEFQVDSMLNRGRCVDMKREHRVNYTFVFQNEERNRCFHCVKILIRTVNVLEKLERKLNIKFVSCHLNCRISIHINYFS